MPTAPAARCQRSRLPPKWLPPSTSLPFPRYPSPRRPKAQRQTCPRTPPPTPTPTRRRGTDLRLRVRDLRRGPPPRWAQARAAGISRWGRWERARGGDRWVSGLPQGAAEERRWCRADGAERSGAWPRQGRGPPEPSMDRGTCSRRMAMTQLRACSHRWSTGLWAAARVAVGTGMASVGRSLAEACPAGDRRGTWTAVLGVGWVMLAEEALVPRGASADGPHAGAVYPATCTGGRSAPPLPP